MRKGLSCLCFLALSLPALAEDTIPTALTKYYQPAQDEFQNRVWIKKDNSNQEYQVCLDKQTTRVQRIAVLCGTVLDAAEPDTGVFDIWYLEGEKIISRRTTEGYGRMGSSGEARAVKIGKKWGVVLESGFILQGIKQTFQQFYLLEGGDIRLIASLPVHSSNDDSDTEKEDLPADNLITKVAFEKVNHGRHPEILLHSFGIISGEEIDKHWSITFDPKLNKYIIPEEINIGY